MNLREIQNEIEELTEDMDGADLETRLDLAFEIGRFQAHHMRLSGCEYQVPGFDDVEI